MPPPRAAKSLVQSHTTGGCTHACGAPASVTDTLRARTPTPRAHGDGFVVSHYAGPVGYVVDGFVEKNRDALFPHVYDVLHASSDSLVQACFPEREEVQSKKETVANKYLSQLVRTRRPIP